MQSLSRSSQEKKKKTRNLQQRKSLQGSLFLHAVNSVKKKGQKNSSLSSSSFEAAVYSFMIGFKTNWETCYKQTPS